MSDVLRDILAEARVHTRLLRRLVEAEGRNALRTAVRTALGPASFTMRGLIDLAFDDPVMADALALLVDVSAPGAAISLQRAVTRWREFEVCGEQRGIRLYRLRD